MKGQSQHRGAESSLELSRSPLGNDFSLFQNDELFGESIGFFEVLRGEEHGHARFYQTFDGAPQVLSTLRVETGGGLIQKKDRWSSHQGSGQVESATHSAGIGLQATVTRVGEIELL